MLLQEPSNPEASNETVNRPAPALPAERFLTRGEAAQYLGLPVTTIYQWARTGRLHCFVTMGGHLRFSKADLDDAAVPRPRAARRRPSLPTPADDSAPSDAPGSDSLGSPSGPEA